MDPRAPGRPRVAAPASDQGPAPGRPDPRGESSGRALGLRDNDGRRQPSCDRASPTRGTRQVAEWAHNVTARREGEPTPLCHPLTNQRASVRCVPAR